MEHKIICDMTPTGFEKCCCDILSGYAESEGLNDFQIIHDKHVKTSDGFYQIDVYAEFTAMHSKFKVLCECKKYKNRVSREKVAVLHRKLESIGANKGVLISTSDFQSGAIEYAKQHGITLIKAEDYDFKNVSFSSGQPGDEDDPFLYMEKDMPAYAAFDITSGTENPRKVFPTKALIKELLIEMTKRVNAMYERSINVDLLGER